MIRKTFKWDYLKKSPDTSGSDGIYLSINRLAIIDIASGQQPIRDRLNTIVFNGEIFNALELREELTNLGVKFETDHSDTEVIIKGYGFYGDEIFSKLNGMFSVAIYDGSKEELILARDTFGIKPLYIKVMEKAIEFASELKALIDENTPAVYENTYLTIKRKSRVNFNTFYKSILEVQPGQIIKINKSLESSTKKFKYSNSKNKKNIAETQKSLRDELILAVSRWAASDVPISLSLSGGLDSSILAVAFIHIRSAMRLASLTSAVSELRRNHVLTPSSL